MLIIIIFITISSIIKQSHENNKFSIKKVNQHHRPSPMSAGQATVDNNSTHWLTCTLTNLSPLAERYIPTKSDSLQRRTNEKKEGGLSKLHSSLLSHTKPNRYMQQCKATLNQTYDNVD